MKNNKAILVCQFDQGIFKAVKYLAKKREVTGLVYETFSSGAPDELSGIIQRLFADPSYQGLPVVFCLARHKATLRLLKKVPAQSAKEIESIVELQAPSCLPYPAQELISGYQVIAVDKEGYSDINMVVVHRETVERYLEYFRGKKHSGISVAVSSYGLLNYYDFLRPEDNDTTILIDADANYPEIAVVNREKLLFSRSFKIDRSLTDWADTFISEIDKSRAAYAKETALPAPKKIAVLGTGSTVSAFLEVISRQGEFAVSAPDPNHIKFSKGISEKMRELDVSFAALIGLAVKGFPENLDLVPTQIKSTNRKNARRKEFLHLAFSICGVLVILGLGIVRSLNNKAVYLGKLKAQLNRISEEAKPLDEIDKKLKAIEGRSRRSPTVLEALHELFRLVQPPVSLTAFSYEEAGQITLRGQAPSLEAVFVLAGELGKSSVFSDFSIKVKYATKKMTASGEVCDFEIECLRGK